MTYQLGRTSFSLAQSCESYSSQTSTNFSQPIVCNVVQKHIITSSQKFGYHHDCDVVGTFCVSPLVAQMGCRTAALLMHFKVSGST